MDSSTAALALFGGAAILFCILGIAYYILMVIAYWKIFTKAGVPGWMSIIPVVNTYQQVKLSWSKTMAWVIVILAAVVSILVGVNNSLATLDPGHPNVFLLVVAAILGIVLSVLSIIATHKLSKAFGKGVGFTLGLIFFNPIFILILAFGPARYVGPQGGK